MDMHLKKATWQTIVLPDFVICTNFIHSMQLVCSLTSSLVSQVFHLLTYDSIKWELATTAAWIWHVQLHYVQNVVHFMIDTARLSFI